MFDALKDKNNYGRMILSVLPLIAVCNTALDSLVASAILVLTGIISVCVLFLLRKLLTPKTAPFALIVISVGTVGILSMIMELFASKQIDGLGVYIPLISLSAIFMINFGEVSNLTVKKSLKKTLAFSLGAVGFIICSAFLREFFGSGAIFGVDIYSQKVTPIGFLTTPAGGFLIAAVLVMVYNVIIGKEEELK